MVEAYLAGLGSTYRTNKILEPGNILPSDFVEETEPKPNISKRFKQDRGTLE